MESEEGSRAQDAPIVKLGERQSIEELTGGRIRKLPRVAPSASASAHASASASVLPGIAEDAAQVEPFDLLAKREESTATPHGDLPVGKTLGFHEP